MVDGRFEKVEGTDFELPCELVLLAMGFVGPERSGLLEDLGVERGHRTLRILGKGSKPGTTDDRL